MLPRLFSCPWTEDNAAYVLLTAPPFSGVPSLTSRTDLLVGLTSRRPLPLRPLPSWSFLSAPAPTTPGHRGGGRAPRAGWAPRRRRRRRGARGRGRCRGRTTPRRSANPETDYGAFGIAS